MDFTGINKIIKIEMAGLSGSAIYFIYMFLWRAIEQIKNYVFPTFCLDCSQEGFWLCDDCYKKLDLSGRFFCPVCHAPTCDGCCCVDCKTNSYLDQEIAILKYSDQEIIGQVIHNLKYNYAEDLQVLLQNIIKDFIKFKPELFKSINQIIPVPLHPRRFAERGFNQAEIIAQILSQELFVPINKNLKRIKYTKQQAKLDKKEREENIEKAFIFSDDIVPRVVIVVDDVFTTGSTMQACAQVLKERGVEKIIGFTLARG